MTLTKGTTPTVLAVDCCEHIIDALRIASNSEIVSISSLDDPNTLDFDNEIKLIVIGASKSSLGRRTVFNRLKRSTPEIPVLFFRLEIEFGAAPDTLRGQFLLSDKRRSLDLKLVREIRRILPIEPCEHQQAAFENDLAQEVTRVLSENYSNAGLDLRQAANKLSVSPTKLSQFLNREINISFRQMLRHIRIEESKRLLATRRFSVKEVARLVGFSDSHYFSRIFKELTGLNPTQYEYSPQELFLHQ